MSKAKDKVAALLREDRLADEAFNVFDEEIRREEALRAKTIQSSPQPIEMPAPPPSMAAPPPPMAAKPRGWGKQKRPATVPPIDAGDSTELTT